MNLGKKKKLAVRAFGVGKERIVFVKSRLDEIKEAITKQDMRDLQKEGAIILRNIGGRKRIKKGKGVKNIRKMVNKRKQDYVILTRKLRDYIQEMKKQGKLSKRNIKEIRKKIRNKEFRSRAHLKEHIGGFQ